MRTIIAIVIVLSAINADAGEREHDAAIRELKTKLTRALPPGWELVEAPRKSADARARITLRTKGKIAVEQIPPSAAPLPPSDPQRNPYLKSMIVAIELRSEPLIAPRRYRELHERNQRFLKQRIAFGQKHLRGLNWRDAKSGQPYAPRIIEPKTTEQKRRVQEYAALWKRTEPRRLPTHHFKSLSFTRVDEPFIMFQDKVDEKRFARISKAIESTLTRYVKAR